MQKCHWTKHYVVIAVIRKPWHNVSLPKASLWQGRCRGYLTAAFGNDASFGIASKIPPRCIRIFCARNIPREVDKNAKFWIRECVAVA